MRRPKLVTLETKGHYRVCAQYSRAGRRGDDALVLMPGHTLYAAVQELLAEYGGEVYFICPNYAVAHTVQRGEVTVWTR